MKPKLLFANCCKGQRFFLLIVFLLSFNIFLPAQNTTDALYIDSTGRIGIGTTKPNAMLTIGKRMEGKILSKAFVSNAGVLDSTRGKSLDIGNIGFTSGNDNISLGIHAARLMHGNDWKSAAITLSLDVNDTTGKSSVLWLSPNGNIGIGTTNSAYKLEVYGNIHSLEEIHSPTYLRADAESFLYANGNKDLSSNVVLRKDGANAYIYPWGTGTTRNTLVVGGGSPANFAVTGDAVINGTTTIVNWSDQKIEANGYARMGSVLIQWGNGNYNNNNEVTVSFPKPFNTVFSITATVDAGVTNNGSGANTPCKVMGFTSTTFKYAGTISFSGDNTSKVRWMAIGN